MSGTATPNLPLANYADDVIGNSGGNTVRISAARLAAILSTLQGPSYGTIAQLQADLSWPAGAIGSVFGGSEAGVYRKSGNAGAGSWTKIGDLPVSALTAAQLAEKADLSVVSALAADLGSGRVWVLPTEAGTPSGDTIPAGVLVVLSFAGDTLKIWRRGVSAPADGKETQSVQKDANGVWWYLKLDAAGIDKAISDLATDLAQGRVYATGAGSITSAAAPTGALRVMTSAGGETQIWGRTDAPDPAVETDTLKRDASGQWWRRHFDTRSIGYLSTGIRETGLIRTTIDAASTGDAIVLSIADGTAAAGISSISTSTWIEYVPSVSNAAANPTITIAGATYGVRDADGGNWPAGGFKAGRSYNLRRRNTTLRVVAGGVDQAELAALTADFSRGRVFAMGAGSPTGGAIPDGTRRILTSAGGETQVWASTTAPDPAVETDTLKQDAAGQWWRRHFDTRDLGALTNEVRTGRTFYLGGALTMSGATVPDNISLVVAGHHASNTVRFWRAIGVPADNTEIPDVRVKDAAGRWWQAMEDAIAKDAVAKLDEGRVFTVYAPTPKGKIVPLKVDGVLALAAGEASLWAPQAAPDLAVETDILKLDANGRWWKRYWSSAASVNQEAFRSASDAVTEYSLLNTRDGSSWLGAYPDGTWEAPTVFGAFRWPGDDIVVFETSEGEPILAFAPDGTLICKRD